MEPGNKMTFIFFCFTLLLIILKLAGILTLAWPWVLCPVLIPLVAAIFLVASALIFIIIIIFLAIVGTLGVVLFALPFYYFSKD